VWLYVLSIHPEASSPVIRTPPRAIFIKPHNPELVACSGSAIPGACHFLGHVQKKLAISLFSFAQQAAKFA
jgi:hypothetical protein